MSGAVALGVVAGSWVPATAGVAQLRTPAPASAPAALSPEAAGALVDVQWSCAGNYCQSQDGERRTRDQLKSRNWNRLGNGWDQHGGGGYNNDDWKPRHPPRYHSYRQPGVYLDFYVPGYRYVPRVQTRRGNVMSAHVEWCYDRYPRSYRPSDNSWKPKNGPRRQCNSPYL